MGWSWQLQVRGKKEQQKRVGEEKEGWWSGTELVCQIPFHNSSILVKISPERHAFASSHVLIVV